jgi:NAD(P)-dependent dehydrogenase (short-subunit alcohol dehydrogenase family)
MNIASYFSTELFKGKTVFVTGGGSGINLGIAKNLASLGANIAICGRTQAKLDKAAAELRALGANVCPVAADVRDFAALEAAFARATQGDPGHDHLHFRRHRLHATRFSGACRSRKGGHRHDDEEPRP